MVGINENDAEKPAEEEMPESPVTVKEEEKEEEKMEEGEGKEKVAPEFVLPLPEDVSKASEEEMKKTTDLLVKGRFVADKYVSELKRIHDNFTERFEEEQEASYKEITEFMEKCKGKRFDFDEDTRTAFAYHIEICKSAVPELFKEEVKEDVAEEMDVKTLLKKAPRLSLSTLNDMIAAGPKVVKEKGNLLSELEEHMEKIKGMESTLRHQITDLLSRDEKETFTFLYDNFSSITALFDKFGKSELVLLGLCKEVAVKVIGFMDECNENWAVVGAGLEEMSTAVSTLVLGPTLKAEQIEDAKALMEHAGSNRSTLNSTLNDLKRKEDTADPVAVKYIKSNLSEDQLTSYNFIMKELVQKLGKNIVGKNLVPEEKVYIGFHMNIVKPAVTKMAELGISRKCLEGRYIFKDQHQGGRYQDRNRRDHRGGGGGGRFSQNRRPDPWGRDRRDNNTNRYGERRNFAPYSFNHSSAY